MRRLGTAGDVAVAQADLAMRRAGVCGEDVDRSAPRVRVAASLVDRTCGPVGDGSCRCDRSNAGVVGTSVGGDVPTVWATIVHHGQARLDALERPASGQLGFDETVMSPAKRHRRRRFIIAAVDVADGRIIDVFEGRNAADLQAWLGRPCGTVISTARCKTRRSPRNTCATSTSPTTQRWPGPRWTRHPPGCTDLDVGRELRTIAKTLRRWHNEILAPYATGASTARSKPRTDRQAGQALRPRVPQPEQLPVPHLARRQRRPTDSPRHTTPSPTQVHRVGPRWADR